MHLSLVINTMTVVRNTLLNSYPLSLSLPLSVNLSSWLSEFIDYKNIWNGHLIISIDLLYISVIPVIYMACIKTRQSWTEIEWHSIERIDTDSHIHTRIKYGSAMTEFYYKIITLGTRINNINSGLCLYIYETAMKFQKWYEV